MKTVKITAGILGATFFFALGIFFRGVLPETAREPASIATVGMNSGGNKFDQRATAAFKGCLDSKVKNGSVTIGKVVVEGRRWQIVSIPCQGAAAKELYHSIQSYSTEELVNYRDKRRGVVRFFGRLYPPSQCVQLLSSAKGKELYDYSCSIRIDVDSEITEQLKL